MDVGVEGAPSNPAPAGAFTEHLLCARPLCIPDSCSIPAAPGTTPDGTLAPRAGHLVR